MSIREKKNRKNQRDILAGNSENKPSRGTVPLLSKTKQKNQAEEPSPCFEYKMPKKRFDNLSLN